MTRKKKTEKKLATKAPGPRTGTKQKRLTAEQIARITEGGRLGQSAAQLAHELGIVESIQSIRYHLRKLVAPALAPTEQPTTSAAE